MARTYSILRSKRHEWEKAWVNNTPKTVRLRQKWNYDRKRYMARFRPDDEVLLEILTKAMHFFSITEERLLRRARFQQHLEIGQRALDAILEKLLYGRADADYEFIAIDFEGAVDQWGITEFGVSKLGSWQFDVRADEEPVIRSLNFALRSKGERKFVFGPSTRLSSELLPNTIVEQFKTSDLSVQFRPIRPRLILVGHGVASDLEHMRTMGVDFEALPGFAGLVDTWELASMILQQHPTLEQLLVALDTPYDYHHLHCAGNDARYTMQAMLALLHVYVTSRTAPCSPPLAEEQLKTLSTMARQPLRSVKKAELLTRDWVECLESGNFNTEECEADVLRVQSHHFGPTSVSPDHGYTAFGEVVQVAQRLES